MLKTILVLDYIAGTNDAPGIVYHNDNKNYSIAGRCKGF